MRIMGQAFVEYLRRDAKSRQRTMFSYDLVDGESKEPLVTRSGDVERIARQMSNPAWIDALPT